VCGVLLTQLGVHFGLQSNALESLYVLLAAISVLLGIVFYGRDVADDLPKTKALELPIIPGTFRILLIAFALGLVCGVWSIRNDPLMILILPLNAVFIWVAYLGDLSVLARRRDRSEQQSVRS
jgi:hypothetical protein